MTCFIPRFCIKILDTLIFGIPRSASSSNTVSNWSSLIGSPHTFNIIRCSTCCKPSRTWITFNKISTVFGAFVLYFYLCCTHCTIWIVSEKECSSLTQNMMQVHCFTHSVILNVMATQYTCSLNSVYCPHWLVQWSRHCSHMHIPVHSPWLPSYINVTQTILIILKMMDFSQITDIPMSISISLFSLSFLCFIFW